MGRTAYPVQRQRLGKGLGSSRSLVESAECYPPKHYAQLTKHKPNKFTKQDARFGSERLGNTKGTTPPALGQSESQLFYATYADKGREKMTLLKLIT